jgi:uncharacterized protein YndB with AHSA1/START domain
VNAEELWDAVATRDGLSSWLMQNDFEPVVGHRFTCQATPRRPVYDGVVLCEVLEVDPPHRLRISWAGGPITTEVVFLVEALAPDRSRLTVEQTGFRGLRAAVVRQVLGAGWRSLLAKKIPAALAAR